MGLNNIPLDWVDKVELSDSILEIADDLFIEHQDTQEWWERYPGY